MFNWIIDFCIIQKFVGHIIGEEALFLGFGKRMEIIFEQYIWWICPKK